MRTLKFIFLLSFLLTSSSCQTKEPTTDKTNLEISDNVKNNSNSNKIEIPVENLKKLEKVKILLENDKLNEAVILLTNRTKSEENELIKTDFENNAELVKVNVLFLKKAFFESEKLKAKSRNKDAVKLYETVFTVAPLGISIIYLPVEKREDIQFITSVNDYENKGYHNFMTWEKYKKILNSYGENLSKIKPRLYTQTVLNQLKKMNQ
jgi:hypothetical protein